MKKTLIAALLVSAGVASQAWGQVEIPGAVHISDGITQIPTTKWGQLYVSLKNQRQAYETPAGSRKWGVEINPGLLGRNWTLDSYDYLRNCLGTVTYRSNTKQISNKSLIDALNAALSRSAVGDQLGGIFVTPGSPYLGKFGNTTAKIIVVNYDNLQQLPPYPPTRDLFGNDTNSVGHVWNAPWNLDGAPTGGNDGEEFALNWPNLNYISWGKPDPNGDGFAWMGTRVFVIDPKNANVNLRCFDVTPFFAFEESDCKFCWDTMDRVTDGKITKSTEIPLDAPCAIPGFQDCGVSGNGTTRIYWTVKFNNVGEDRGLNPNLSLFRYYVGYLGMDTEWGSIYGAILDDANISVSENALIFNVSGIATYTWKFKKLSDGFTWPMGKYNMATSAGHGYSPMCGVFSGPVSITEYDRTSSSFGGASCLDY